MRYNTQSLIEVVSRMIEWGDNVSLVNAASMWRMWYPALRCPRDAEWIAVFESLGLESVS